MSRNKHSHFTQVSVYPSNLGRVRVVSDLPAREQVAVKDLVSGHEVGWLTVLARAVSSDLRIPCRCRCGQRLWPVARDVSLGRWLDCGLIRCPVTGDGHGWSGIPVGPELRRPVEQVLPLAA
jgi:hypothetical protein